MLMNYRTKGACKGIADDESAVRLCEMAPSGCYNWNDEPVQDIVDDSLAACGYHVLFYLYAKHRDPDLTLHDVVKYYYSPDSLRLNDVFAIVFIEHKMV